MQTSPKNARISSDPSSPARACRECWCSLCQNMIARASRQLHATGGDLGHSAATSKTVTMNHFGLMSVQPVAGRPVGLLFKKWAIVQLQSGAEIQKDGYESSSVIMGEHRLCGVSFKSYLANILHFIGIAGDRWITCNLLCKMYQGTVDVTWHVPNIGLKTCK